MDKLPTDIFDISWVTLSDDDMGALDTYVTEQRSGYEDRELLNLVSKMRITDMMQSFRDREDLPQRQLTRFLKDSDYSSIYHAIAGKCTVIACLSTVS